MKKPAFFLLPIRSVVAAVIAITVLCTPVLAHHSYAMFDLEKTVVHEGVVKRFLWTNPHSLLIVTVTDADGVEHDYNYEANGPGYLARNGWKRQTVRPGDRVTIVSNPLMDGSPGGNLVALTLPDGTTLSAQPGITPNEVGELIGEDQ
jgi:hypothetical protein